MKKEKTPFLEQAANFGFVCWYPEESCYVNLAGNYDYLEQPYYTSQEYELAGHQIRPTCKEMLDSYVTPISLEKAKLSGIKVPEYYLSNGYFEPPVVIDTINPFMTKSRIVTKSNRVSVTSKSLTRNFTYAICCQEIPQGAQVKKFRAVMGWSTIKQYRPMAKAIWDVFHIPLATIRIMVYSDGTIALSDISRLPIKQLGVKEQKYLQEIIEWQS